MTPAFRDDADLLHHLKSHDKTAFEWLYRLYWQRLYDFAILKTQDANVAEELVQDLFVTLWEKRESLHITNFQSYLFAAIRNRIIDYYKRKIFAELDTIEEPDGTEYPIFFAELEAVLHEAIGQLPEKTQEIFRLNRLEDQTASQIAKLLNLPERTVEYHITQALRKLKILLKDYLTLFVVLCQMVYFKE